LVFIEGVLSRCRAALSSGSTEGAQVVIGASADEPGFYRKSRQKEIKRALNAVSFGQFIVADTLRGWFPNNDIERA
jgi:hypothetical protein